MDAQAIISELTDTDRQTLLRLARESIAHGLRTGGPMDVPLESVGEALRQVRATFVTLERLGQLRGCIGTLEPRRVLAVDVATNAYSAAFRDPRFPPLSDFEFELLDVHISILGSPEPVAFESESHLISLLRPGVDGLILEDGLRRGTFLPSVWEQVPEPAQFLRHLKIKAGMPVDFWSDTVRVYRYTAESVCAR